MATPSEGDRTSTKTLLEDVCADFETIDIIPSKASKTPNVAPKTYSRARNAAERSVPAEKPTRLLEVAPGASTSISEPHELSTEVLSSENISNAIGLSEPASVSGDVDLSSIAQLADAEIIQTADNSVSIIISNPRLIKVKNSESSPVMLVPSSSGPEVIEREEEAISVVESNIISNIEIQDLDLAISGNTSLLGTMTVGDILSPKKSTKTWKKRGQKGSSNKLVDRKNAIKVPPKVVPKRRGRPPKNSRPVVIGKSKKTVVKKAANLPKVTKVSQSVDVKPPIVLATKSKPVGRKSAVYQSSRPQTKARRVSAKMKEIWTCELQKTGSIACKLGCNQTYVTLANFITHYKFCTGKKNLLHCPYCDSLIFSTNAAVMQHMKVEHPEKLEEYKAQFPEQVEEYNSSAASSEFVVTDDENSAMNVGEVILVAPNTGGKRLQSACKENVLPSPKAILKQNMKSINEKVNENIQEFKKCVRFDQIIDQINSVEDFTEVIDKVTYVPKRKYVPRSLKEPPKRRNKRHIIDPKFVEEKKYFEDDEDDVYNCDIPDEAETEEMKYTKARMVLNLERYKRYKEYLKVTRDWSSERRTYSRSKASDTSLSDSSFDVSTISTVSQENVLDVHQMDFESFEANITLKTEEPSDSSPDKLTSDITLMTAFQPPSVTRNDIMALHSMVGKKENPEGVANRFQVCHSQMPFPQVSTPLCGRSVKSPRRSFRASPILQQGDSVGSRHSRGNIIGGKEKVPCYLAADSQQALELATTQSEQLLSADEPQAAITFDSLLSQSNLPSRAEESASKEGVERRESSSEVHSEERQSNFHRRTRKKCSPAVLKSLKEKAMLRRAKLMKLKLSAKLKSGAQRIARLSQMKATEIEGTILDECLEQVMVEDGPDDQAMEPSVKKEPTQIIVENDPNHVNHALGLSVDHNYSSADFVSIDSMNVIAEEIEIVSCDVEEPGEKRGFEVEEGLQAISVEPAADSDAQMAVSESIPVADLSAEKPKTASATSDIQPSLHENLPVQPAESLLENQLQGEEVENQLTREKTDNHLMETESENQEKVEAASQLKKGEAEMQSLGREAECQLQEGKEAESQLQKGKEAESQLQEGKEAESQLQKGKEAECQLQEGEAGNRVEGGEAGSRVEGGEAGSQVEGGEAGSQVEGGETGSQLQRRGRRQAVSKGESRKLVPRRQRSSMVNQEETESKNQEEEATSQLKEVEEAEYQLQEGGAGSQMEGGEAGSQLQGRGRRKAVSRGKSRKVVGRRQRSTMENPEKETEYENQEKENAASHLKEGEVNRKSQMEKAKNQLPEGEEELGQLQGEARSQVEVGEAQSQLAVREAESKMEEGELESQLKEAGSQLQEGESESQLQGRAAESQAENKTGSQLQGKANNQLSEGVAEKVKESSDKEKETTSESVNATEVSSSERKETELVNQPRRGRPKKKLKFGTYSKNKKSSKNADDSSLDDSKASEAASGNDLQLALIGNVETPPKRGRGRPKKIKDTPVVNERNEKPVPVVNTPVTLASEEAGKSRQPSPTPQKEKGVRKSERVKKRKLPADEVPQTPKVRKPKVETPVVRTGKRGRPRKSIPKEPQQVSEPEQAEQEETVENIRKFLRKGLPQKCVNHKDINSGLESSESPDVGGSGSKSKAVLKEESAAVAAGKAPEEDEKVLPLKKRKERKSKNDAKKAESELVTNGGVSAEIQDKEVENIPEEEKMENVSSRSGRKCRMSLKRKLSEESVKLSDLLDEESDSDEDYDISEPKKYKKKKADNCNKSRSAFPPKSRLYTPWPRPKPPTRLFMEYKPKKYMWQLLSGKNYQEYLPPLKNSVYFKIKKSWTLDESDWSSLKCFGSLPIDKKSPHVTFFTGGPILCSAWCPTPAEEKPPQYIAISTSSSFDKYCSYTSTEPDRGLVQIWNVGQLTGKIANSQPVMDLCISHNHGFVSSMAWCPFGCWESPTAPVVGKSLPRMGLLALACSDSCIRVYSIPHPRSLPKPKEHGHHPVFSACPSMVLKPLHSGPCRATAKSACISVDWQKSEQCERIAAGYGNGMVCIWLFNSSSVILSSKENGQLILNPYLIFNAHGTPVMSLSLSPLPPGGRFLLTASYDKSVKGWDLHDTSVPSFSLRKGYSRNVEWLDGYFGAIFSVEAGISGKGGAIYKEWHDYSLHSLTSCRCCSLLDSSLSQRLSAQAHADLSGVVSVNFFSGMATDKSRSNFEKPVYEVESGSVKLLPNKVSFLNETEVMTCDIALNQMLDIVSRVDKLVAFCGRTTVKTVEDPEKPFGINAPLIRRKRLCTKPLTIEEINRRNAQTFSSQLSDMGDVISVSSEVGDIVASLDHLTEQSLAIDELSKESSGVTQSLDGMKTNAEEELECMEVEVSAGVESTGADSSKAVGILVESGMSNLVNPCLQASGIVMDITDIIGLLRHMQDLVEVYANTVSLLVDETPIVSKELMGTKAKEALSVTCSTCPKDSLAAVDEISSLVDAIPNEASKHHEIDLFLKKLVSDACKTLSSDDCQTLLQDPDMPCSPRMTPEDEQCVGPTKIPCSESSDIASLVADIKDVICTLSSMPVKADVHVSASLDASDVRSQGDSSINPDVICTVNSLVKQVLCRMSLCPSESLQKEVESLNDLLNEMTQNSENCSEMVEVVNALSDVEDVVSTVVDCSDANPPFPMVLPKASPKADSSLECDTPVAVPSQELGSSSLTEIEREPIPVLSACDAPESILEGDSCSQPPLLISESEEQEMSVDGGFSDSENEEEHEDNEPDEYCFDDRPDSPISECSFESNDSASSGDSLALEASSEIEEGDASEGGLTKETPTSLQLTTMSPKTSDCQKDNTDPLEAELQKTVPDSSLRDPRLRGRTIASVLPDSVELSTKTLSCDDSILSSDTVPLGSKVVQSHVNSVVSEPMDTEEIISGEQSVPESGLPNVTIDSSSEEEGGDSPVPEPVDLADLLSEEDEEVIPPRKPLYAVEDILSENGIIFTDMNTADFESIPERSDEKYACPTDKHNLMLINSVAFNPNSSSRNWLFSAGHAGIARLSYISDSGKKSK